jgi:hypothetical protein
MVGECVRDALDREGVPSALALADMVCQGPDVRSKYAVCLGEILLRSRVEDAWAYVAKYQLKCPRYRETGILLEAVQHAERMDPQWALALRLSIRPELVFGADLGEAPVQILEHFALLGEANARRILEDGGRGALGGTPEQVRRSAVIAIVTEPDPVAKLRYIGSVLDSATREPDPRIGSMLVQMLVERTAWPDGDCSPAMDLVWRVLDDADCRRSASSALLRQADAVVPGPCAEVWGRIQSRAREHLGTR